MTEDLQPVIDTAYAAAEPMPLGTDGRFFSVIAPSGAQHIVVDREKLLDQYRDRPRRKNGVFAVHDVPSFAAYFDKHRLPETEVWADITKQSMFAVINAHTSEENEAGWQDHRLVYAVKHTEAWKAWIGINGNLMSQTEFAEHIEARAIDIHTPSSAAMLDIAQTFEAKTSVEFESGEVLSSGERKLKFKETVNAKAGQSGSIDIPKEIILALIPFEGSDAYKVTARFRYRINGGKLFLGVVLERPEDILRDAFTDVVDKVETAIQHAVLRGSGTY